MYGYGKLIDLIWLESLQMRAEHWFLTEVLVWTTLVQLVAAVAGTGIAYGLARIVTGRLKRWTTGLRMTEKTARSLLRIAASLVFPLAALLTFLLLRAVAEGLGWPVILLTTVINLVLVWIVIRLASWLIRNETWSRIVALAAFAVATLDILGLLRPTLLLLDDVGVRIGTTYVSVLEVFKGGISLAAFVWLAAVLARVLEQRLERAQSLTPSLKLLTGKLLKVTLIAAAVLFVLDGMGIDLTAFAVFTGALGVGIGFGLQKPIANLISGIILLLDRSIKPGDVVELGQPHGPQGQIFGWVTALNARYASITTRDGTEWLIPNEELITTRVVNWSFSDNRLRLLTPIGVSFECDVRKAMQLAEEAARETPRVMADPAPVCRLMGFADSTVNLELRFWISDPVNGVINVRSAVLLALWEKFREHGIRTPLGHRDVFIKSGSEITLSAPEDRPRDRREIAA